MNARRTAVLCTALLLAGSGVRGQDMRGTLLTTARYVQLRPLALLEIPRDSVVEVAPGRYEYRGAPAYCRGADTCIQYEAAAVQNVVALTQDVGFTAWGFGAQGLSATVQLRGRAAPAGDLTWPRSGDAFDAILAYAELNRRAYRVRVGRQRTLSGLGFSGYDGLSLRVDPVSWMRLEAYGGRSLARGLEEPRQNALAGIEPFLVDRSAYLYGGAVQAEPFPGTIVEARYQREIWSSLSSLISERASLDVHTSLKPLQIEASADWDFGYGRVGRAHLTTRLPALEGRLALEATARRYVPYFELWTIWGMFSPVAFNEGVVRVRWTPTPAAELWASGGYREYEDANAPVILVPLEGSARRFAVGGSLRSPDFITLRGSYERDWGAGAALSSGDMAATWHAGRRFDVTLRGSAFQQVREFRAGEGLVLGGGAGGSLTITSAIRLSGGVDLYHQTFENRPGSPDWDQLRGWAALRVGFGEDPGRGGGAP